MRCHRAAGGMAPMSLETYEVARRYATRIKYKTGLRDVAGAMPPWYVEKDIGIQEFKNDMSLSDEEIATLAAWADNGAPEGAPADMPPRLEFDDSGDWTIRPDLVVTSEELFVEALAPDWWGEIEPMLIPLEEDRYVSAVEIRGVPNSRRVKVGMTLFYMGNGVKSPPSGIFHQFFTAAQRFTNARFTVNAHILLNKRTPNYLEAH